MSWLGHLFGGTRYQYEVGNIVHLAGAAQLREIRWRGYLLVGPPGRRRRVPVYWLDDGHWDCYYEDELASLGELPF